MECERGDSVVDDLCDDHDLEFYNDYEVDWYDNDHHRDDYDGDDIHAY
jgi:hypothetical protein